MAEPQTEIAEIDARIAIVRANLTESMEQAAAISGGAVEELYAERIAAQEAELKRLIERRDAVA